MTAEAQRGRRRPRPPPLARPPSVSPLSFCTLSNERRRVREVKVQPKDKPLFARKQKPRRRGVSPGIAESGESVTRGELSPLPCHSLQECAVRSTLGKVAAPGTAFLPRFLLGKHPGAGMSISCLTPTTCSPTDQSRAKSFSNSLQR